jgi:hypothetical protein
VGSKNIQFYRPIEGWDLWKVARRANFALFMTEGTGARCLCLAVVRDQSLCVPQCLQNLELMGMFHRCRTKPRVP